MFVGVCRDVAGDLQRLAESVDEVFVNKGAMEAALSNVPFGATARTLDPPATWMYQGVSDWGALSAPPQWVPIAGRVPVLAGHKRIGQAIEGRREAVQS